MSGDDDVFVDCIRLYMVQCLPDTMSLEIYPAVCHGAVFTMMVKGVYMVMCFGGCIQPYMVQCLPE